MVHYWQQISNREVFRNREINLREPVPTAAHHAIMPYQRDELDDGGGVFETR
jgi:hypothetical protein